MTKTRLIIGVVTFSSVGMAVPSMVFAQHGPGMHGSHPVQAAYDVTSEATVTGIIADVKGHRSAVAALFRIHTLGLGHQRVRETRLVLKTDTDSLEVHLGPTAFLSAWKVEIRGGDTLEVTGSRITIGASQVLLAREIRKGEMTWTLREVTGQPLWNSVEVEPRGFWTTKRVVLAVVVAKVVALATVLRH